MNVLHIYVFKIFKKYTNTYINNFFINYDKTE